MLIDESKKEDLIRLNLDGGLSEFEAYLGKQIFLPPDRNQWPSLEFIRKANSFRKSQS